MLKRFLHGIKCREQSDNPEERCKDFRILNFLKREIAGKNGRKHKEQDAEKQLLFPHVELKLFFEKDVNGFHLAKIGCTRRKQITWFEKNCAAQCIRHWVCESSGRILCIRSLSFYEQVCSLNDIPILPSLFAWCSPKRKYLILVVEERIRCTF